MLCCFSTQHTNIYNVVSISIHVFFFSYASDPPPRNKKKVHERSVDTDLLCLFAKRLVETHPTLRLIVMSATLSANVIGEYYGLKSPPLFVGARRFPVRYVH